MGKNKYNFEEEFRASQVYKTLSNTGSTVADKIAEGLGAAGNAIGGALNNLSGQPNNGQAGYNNNVKYDGKFNYDPHTGRPIEQNQTKQNVQGNYTPPKSYAPPANQQGVYSNSYQYASSSKQGIPNPPPGVRPTTAPKKEDYMNRGAQQAGSPNTKQNMVMVRQPSVAKFYITGIVALIYALAFPMYQLVHFIVFAMVLVIVFALSNMIFKGKKTFVPAPVEPEPAPELSKTGNPEVDKIINEGHDYIRQLKHINSLIPDEKISEYITRMENASEGIFKYVADNPSSAPQIRTFMSYYLPTTMKLLTSYHRLDSQAVKGDNIKSTMLDIERMLSTVATAFEKQLDSLFGDEALDIGTDISVFETMLKQEGFAPDNMDITATKKGASEKEAPSEEPADLMPDEAKLDHDIKTKLDVDSILEDGDKEPRLTLDPDGDEKTQTK